MSKAIVAKFMGYNTRMFQVYLNKPEQQIWFLPGEDFPSNYLTEPELRFDESWKELMPVIEKIESLGYDTGICGVTIKGEKLTEVIISPIVKGDGKVEFHSRSDDSKIKLTFDVAVQFITWYTLKL